MTLTLEPQKEGAQEGNLCNFGVGKDFLVGANKTLSCKRNSYIGLHKNVTLDIIKKLNS